MLLSEIAFEIFEICVERTNSTKRCVELISERVIGKSSAANDEKLESMVRNYRESRRGLEELAKYIMDWKYNE